MQSHTRPVDYNICLVQTQRLQRVFQWFTQSELRRVGPISSLWAKLNGAIYNVASGATARLKFKIFVFLDL